MHDNGSHLRFYWQQHHSMSNDTDSRISKRKLQGKTVVVTGASSGVGRAIALEFAQNGATIVASARRAEALQEVVTACQDMGATAIAVPTDVTDPIAVQQLATAAAAVNGTIAIWVNNAGVLAAGGFDQTPIEVHDQVVKTNLLGYLHGAHAALPYFKQQGYGLLINNISVGGWFPTPYAVGYSASKFGLRGFSEALRGELHQWPHIHVCDVFPAFLDTPGMQHAANYTGHSIKPAPPVYDPQRVARTMVALAVQPKKAAVVGSAALLLKVAHSLFPSLSRYMTASVIETYLKKAPPMEATNGNLFEPVDYGTSIYGGWSTSVSDRTKKLTGALLIGVAVSLLLFSRRKA